MFTCGQLGGSRERRAAVVVAAAVPDAAPARVSHPPWYGLTAGHAPPGAGARRLRSKHQFLASRLHPAGKPAGTRAGERRVQRAGVREQLSRLHGRLMWRRGAAVPEQVNDHHPRLASSWQLLTHSTAHHTSVLRNASMPTA